MSHRPRPPRLAEALLRRFLPADERDEIVGDMSETYGRRAARRRGRLDAGANRAASSYHPAARVWYRRHAIAIPPRLWWRRAGRARLDGLELRHAVRSLARSPGFTAVAVLSFALGIGANTAIFSTVRAVLYTPLPVESPEELALVYHSRLPDADVINYSSSQTADPATGALVGSNYSYATYQAMRQAVGDSAELLGFNFARQVSVVVDDAPAVGANAVLASGDYFSTLHIQTVVGRPLDEGDDRPDSTRVAVISHSFWQRAFGGDPTVLDRPVLVNGTPFRIVGVTEPGFDGLSPGGFFATTEITFPLSAQPVVVPSWAPEDGSLFSSENRFWLRMIARIPSGAERQPLDDALTAALRATLVSSDLISSEDAEKVKVYFLPGARGLDSLRSDTERPLRILAIVVAVVLLIACANLASLMLARGAARRHEIAVRRALGAGRLRLMRQVFLESSLLALAGGVLGLLLALWSRPAIAAALTAQLGTAAVHFAVDGTLLVMTIAVSFAAAILCALLPALVLSRSDPRSQLASRDGAEGGGRLPLGRILIAGQIAVSIPLIVGAGLFLRTLANLNDIDPGFDAAGLTIFQLDPSMTGVEPEQATRIVRNAIDNLEAIPGVVSATVIENVLVSGWTSNAFPEIDGEKHEMYMNAVGPRFFETFAVPIIAGRPIEATDDADAPRVVVINETAADRLFQGQAVGRRFRLGEQEVEVVGVAADTTYESLRADVRPTFFDSYLQRPGGIWQTNVVVRTSVPAAGLEPQIREAVARADRNLPVTDLRGQAEQIEATVSRERVFARLLAVFGAFALLVACIGLHGVTAFAVARRRNEIGVRLALGAQPSQILWLVLRQVLLLTIVGLAIGLVAARFAGPVLASMLYGLEPDDPTTMAIAAAVMLAVALLAGLLPARRAARTDALIALGRD